MPIDVMPAHARDSGAIEPEHERGPETDHDHQSGVAEAERLTMTALHERQEHELLDNRDFGLLHNTGLAQPNQSPTGPPTPDATDDLPRRRRRAKLFLVHPKAIAVFGREGNSRGIYPDTVYLGWQQLSAWRGVPIYPRDKTPISGAGTTSIMAMRTGEGSHGVVGLRRTGIPDERP